jgi:hypothetical protein
MATYVNKKFVNERMDVDASSFEKCRFEKCQIVYSGGDSTQMSGCTFDDQCTFGLDGPASRTLTYLHGMYHNMGPGGAQIVEKTFDGIRHGPATDVSLVDRAV